MLANWPVLATTVPSAGSAVVGVLMNDPAALAALGEAATSPPYKAAPTAPVLFVKPRNTYAASGATFSLPPGVDEVELGASIGLVIGRAACRVAADDALSHLAGLCLVADLSVPHASFYRPAVRCKALDGSCPIGPLLAPMPDVDERELDVRVDGRSVQRFSARTFVRGAARLLADVSDFMTLRPGDILLLGTAAGAPRLRHGQHFEVFAAGFAPLDGAVRAQAA